MFGREFSFAEGAEGIRLSAGDCYDESKGYGFLGLTAQERPADRFTGTGGWNPRETYCTGDGEEAGLWQDGADGVEVKAGFPLRFRAAVPGNGSYAVTVTIRGGREGAQGLMLYTGRRNLIKRDIVILPGEVFSCRFYVRVCEYIPVVGEGAKEDNSVYVTVLGAGKSNARISGLKIEEAQAPTVFIAGDSLVADYDGLYPYNPIINGGSWGQNLPQYFDGVAFSNQAHGGMTTNCFRDDGHWDIVCKNIRPGDIFLMEFGHNDQKRRYLKAFDQYAANLRRYVRQIREKGAYPMIVTSLSRIPGKNEDGYFDLLEDYALSCLRVGRELHVPVIDLHAYSFRTLCEMGPEVTPDYFMDTTHTNDYGALLTAGFIAEEIVRLQAEPLCGMRNEFAGEPWKPDVSLRPADTVSSAQKEERPILPTDLPELPYADCKGICQEGMLKKAMGKGLLDPCILFFHPFDEIPRGQFLYLFFKAAPTPAKRGYQGRFCDIYRYEFDAQNVQTALDAGLVDEATTPEDRFRPDDGLTCGELAEFMVRNLQPEGKRELDMQTCEQEAKRLGLLWDGYERNAAVNRADCTAALVRMMEIREKEN